MTIERIIEGMSLEEKCALMSGKNHWESWDFKKHGVKSLMMSDGPHGVRKQLGSADHLGLNKSIASTCFPTAATVANSWDVAIAEELGNALGIEAASLDVNILLGPGMNIKRSPLCGRNFEYFSEDPFLSGKMAAGYVRGIQDAGIAACPKHFAVNSQETIRMSSDSIVDERALREIYLTAFEIVVKESHPRALMTGYNKINGIYGNEHDYLLNEVLRSEWGFDGVVVTDWGGSNDHVAGVKAGSALEMPNPGLEPARILLEAIKNGELDEATLDKRVTEILKETFFTRKKTTFDEQEHHNLAKKVAEESIVLLRNENKILPLNKQTKCAVIGDFAITPRYQGSGSSFVEPTILEQPLTCLEQSKLDIVGFAKGFERNGMENAQLIEESLLLAKDAEVVLLYLGLPENFETEGMDRETLKIPVNQIKLIEALKSDNNKIITIFSAGAATEMQWLQSTDAALHCYLGGQAGALAVVDVLTGKVNPSGKLAETFANQIEDTPTADIFPSMLPKSMYKESIFVGYRYYDKANVEIALPFGFGLSYTQFEYSNIEVAKDKVTFTITNIGKYAGSEIAQMYVRLQESSIFRAEKELKGFTKVYLEPGVSKEVTIEFDEMTFRYYNVATASWEIEKGSYEVLIGKNSRDICLSGKVEIEGTTKETPYTIEILSLYKNADVKNISDESFAVLLGKELPENKWPEEIKANTPVLQIEYSKSWLARQMFKVLDNKRKKAEARGTPDLNILFMLNIPFRGIAKMTGGLVGVKMVDGMLLVVNGHFFKGMGKIISGYFSNKKENKKYLKQLEEN